VPPKLSLTVIGVKLRAYIPHLAEQFRPHFVLAQSPECVGRLRVEAQHELSVELSERNACSLGVRAVVFDSGHKIAVAQEANFQFG
jgi:hypothetical protein